MGHVSALASVGRRRFWADKPIVGLRKRSMTRKIEVLHEFTVQALTPYITTTPRGQERSDVTNAQIEAEL